MIAQVLKVASSITRQEANPKRFEEGMCNWRDMNKFKFVLGDSTVSNKRMDLHGLVSITRRMSCNNYWTAVAVKKGFKVEIETGERSKIRQIGIR